MFILVKTNPCVPAQNNAIHKHKSMCILQTIYFVILPLKATIKPLNCTSMITLLISYRLVDYIVTDLLFMLKRMPQIHYNLEYWTCTQLTSVWRVFAEELITKISSHIQKSKLNSVGSIVNGSHVHAKYWILIIMVTFKCAWFGGFVLQHFISKQRISKLNVRTV